MTEIENISDHGDASAHPFHSEGGDVIPADTLPPHKKKKPDGTEVLLATANRQLPFSDEAEKGVLSCLLQDSRGWVSDVRMLLPPDAFYHGPNRMVFEMILALEAKGAPVEVVSLSNALRDKGDLDKVGGPAAISELYTFVPIDAHFPYYARVVRTKYLTRLLIRAHAEGLHDAHDFASTEVDADPTELITRNELKIFNVLEASQQSGAGAKVINASDAINDWHDVFEKICNNKGEIPGIKTGWVDVDRAFHGLAPDVDGDLFVFGGFPGMGKTAAAITLAEEIAIEQKIPTLVFPEEMGYVGWHHRLVLGRARVNVMVSRNGFLRREYLGPIGHARSDIASAPIYWHKGSGIEIDQLCALATMHIRRHKVKCIIIDHFGQIKPSAKTGRDDERLGQKEIMEKLHALRRTHGILIILCVQLDKNARERQSHNRPPTNGDIRGASEMVEYPTQIGFIHRPDEVVKWQALHHDDEAKNRQEAWRRLTSDYRLDFPEAWHDGRGLPEGVSVDQRDYEEHARFVITKNRNGPTGDDICLRFVKEYQRFRGRTLKLYSSNAKFRQVKLPGF